jgi:hypothetical protein
VRADVRTSCSPMVEGTRRVAGRAGTAGRISRESIQTSCLLEYYDLSLHTVQADQYGHTLA